MAPLPESVYRTVGQLFRYGLSGATINLALYGVYVLLTLVGMAPIAASTLVFVMGVPISLHVHGAVTFRNRPSSRRAVLLFWAAYILAYFVQIGGLSLMHFGLGIPHRIAQLIAMVLVAIVLFVIQKRLVFKV